MKEEGIFPDLDDETIQGASTPEDFRELIDAQINAGLDERQKRVYDALNNGVEPSDIRKYENTLNYLTSIKDQDIMAETDAGEKLRYSLIYQDLINKGMTPQKAQKLTQRSIDSGTDLEDAKDALVGNREFFQGAYDKMLGDAQKQAEKEKAERQAQAKKLKDSIMKDQTLMGDIEVNNDTRKKVFENISKPVYRDPDTGEYYTALQKYEMEHGTDFLKYVGLVYTLTNGFKDFDSFTRGKVRKEVNKGLRNLEKTLNSTRRNADGSLNLVTGVKDDSESFIGKGFKLNF